MAEVPNPGCYPVNDTVEGFRAGGVLFGLVVTAAVRLASAW